MAVPSYTEDLSDITLAEDTTGWSAYGGGGAGLDQNADIAMQGSFCVGKQITNADKGQYYTSGAAITLGTDEHVFIWHFCGTPGLTDLFANKGASVLIGSASNNWCQYHIEGNDTYGAAGRVAKCYPIDYTVRTASTGLRTVTGTPGASPQLFGGGLVTTATVKGFNVGIDAMRYGTGAYLTAGELISAGDASNNPCTFGGYNTQNDNINNRWGLLTAVGGSYELQGKFVIGQNNAHTATLCRFQDSDVNIVIPNTLHTSSTFHEIKIDHASTVCNLTNIGITALGTTSPGVFTVTTNNPTVNITNGNWTSIGTITFRSNTTVSGLVMRNTDQIALNGATLDEVLVDSNNNAVAVTTSDLEIITDSTFISGGTGHAIEIDTAGTYSFIGNTFENYSTGTDANGGTTGDTNSAIWFNPTGGTGNLVINVSGGGSTPTVLNSSSGTVTINNTVSLTISNVYPDSEIRIFTDDSNRTELAGTESVVNATLTSIQIVSGGTGYVVSDVLTLTGGTFTTAAQVTVTAVNGGVITGVSITNPGAGYSASPTTPTSVTGGTGTSATFSPTIRGDLIYNYNYTTPDPIIIVVFHLSYKDVFLKGQTLKNSSQNIPIQQIVDRVYLNP